MHKSETITTIAAALAKAHASIGAASKDADNSFFKSRYADLGSIMAACKEPLSANGISIVQLVSSTDNGTTLETMLLHTSGEFLATEMKVVPTKPNDMQALGSAITYCRRYALQAMLSIPSVDDDAEWAERALRNRPPEKTAEEKAREEAAAGSVIDKWEPPKPGDSTSNPETVDWHDVVIHFGDPAKSQYYGKKLGELASGQLRWVCVDWLKLAKTNAKDKALAAIITSAMESGALVLLPAEAPKTPPEPSTPPPEPENAGKAAKKRKAKPPVPGPTAPPPTGTPSTGDPAKPEPPMEWRSVVCTIGKTITGKTLGEIASSKPGEFGKTTKGNDTYPRDWFGLLVKEGIPALEKKGDVKSKVLINAIRAACEETGALLNEAQLREELIRRFEALGLSSAQAADHLLATKVFAEETESLQTVGEPLLRYLCENWIEVAATVKGDK